MLYSKPCEYAFCALTWLATNGGGQAKQIAKDEKLPSYFLSRILKDLAAKKILVSTRGRTGGFILARKPEKISLEQIVIALDGVDDLERCAVGWAECSDSNPCSLRNRFKPIRNKVRNYLKNTSIAHLARVVQSRKKVSSKN